MDTLGKYISTLYRQNNAYLSKKFSKFEIGPGQYLFLIHLYRNDGINQEALSEMINIDKGTTAKAITKLEQLQFVTRVKDDKDKRTNRIYLTEKALEIKSEFYEILESCESHITANLTKEEIELGLKILKKMSNNY